MLRRELEARWLAVASIGIACGAWASRDWLGAVACAALALAVSRRGARVALLLCAFLGWILAPRPEKPSASIEGSLRGEVDVISAPRSTRSGESALVRSSRGRFVMLYKGQHDIGLGDRLLVSGDVAPLREGSEEYWQDRGVLGSLLLDAPPRPVERGALLWRLGNRLRTGFQEFVSNSIAGPNRSVVEALCFNQDSGVSDSLRDGLQRTGTIHIVSTSGLHVVFLAGVVLWILSWLPVPRWAQLFLLGCVLLVYGAAAGLRPPAVRAIVMVLVFLSSYLVRREPDALSAMGAAFLASFLWSPGSVFDAGLQLSFVTLGSLVLFADLRWESVRGAWGWLATNAKATARSSLIASGSSAPLTGYYFGYLSIVAVVANVLIFPAVLGVMVLALGAYALSFVAAAPAHAVLAFAASPLAAYLQWVVTRLGEVPCSALYTPPFSGYWLLPVYLFGLLLWRPRARPE